MIPFILGAIGGALLGSAMKKESYEEGGMMAYGGGVDEFHWKNTKHGILLYSKNEYQGIAITKNSEGGYYVTADEGYPFYDDFEPKQVDTINQAKAYANKEISYKMADGGMMAKGGNITKGKVYYLKFKKGGVDGFDLLKVINTSAISRTALSQVPVVELQVIDSYDKSRIGKIEQMTKKELKYLLKYDIIQEWSYANGGMMANGGGVDIFQKFAVIREQVKFACLKAVGIDEAYEVMQRDYVISPYSLLEKAVYYKILGVHEINKDVFESAIDESEHIDSIYKDSGHGIGGSDMTHFVYSFMKSAGFNVGFVNNTLERLDESGNPIEIDSDLPETTMFAEGGTMADGGVVEVGGWHRNIMGTLSFDLKTKGMRKTQEFIVYPISMGDTKIMIQSDTRIGHINMEDGRGYVTPSHPNGAYGVHLIMDKDKLIHFQLTNEQFDTLKMELAKTSGKNVGSSVVKSDNEGASQFI